MPFQFYCPQCQALVTTATGKPGSLVTCGHCHMGVIVPQVTLPAPPPVPHATIVATVPPLRDPKPRSALPIPTLLVAAGVGGLLLIVALIGSRQILNHAETVSETEKSFPSPDKATVKPNKPQSAKPIDISPKKNDEEKPAVKIAKPGQGEKPAVKVVKSDQAEENEPEVQPGENKPYASSSLISVRYVTVGMAGFLQITNRSTDPIKIIKVVYNGERRAITQSERGEERRKYFEGEMSHEQAAERGIANALEISMRRLIEEKRGPGRKKPGPLPSMPIQRFPITLTIGEYLNLIPNYNKQIIFVDVYTGRGTFRFELGE